MAWADTGGRGLAFAVRPRVRTQRGWRTTQDHVSPSAPLLHPRPSGLLLRKRRVSPDGSSVYVVVRRRGGLPPHLRFAAAATVMRRDAKSAPTYSSRYCRLTVVVPVGDFPAHCASVPECHLRRPKTGRRMGRVVVINHLTLDGVMQAPGRPDEDTRGGFTHGGWSVPNVDDAMMDVVLGTRTSASGGLLLGRCSYEDMLGYWNTQDSPFKDMLNNALKYVASRTLREPLPWANSTLLQGDVAAAVAQLKRRSEADLTVMGSGELIQTLMRHNLIDEYLLLIHPLVLGTGRRLFTDGGPTASLRLVDGKTSTTGVLIATYEPAN